LVHGVSAGQSLSSRAADTCIARLHDLVALGLDRVVVVPGSRDTDPVLLASSNDMFAEQVLLALR
jgi:5,10-methylenetetrahydromethanopterin reductase